VIDLSNEQIETPEQVAARIRRALPYVDPVNLIARPLRHKYLPRDIAFAKMQAMVAGAQLARAQLGRSAES